MDIPGLPGFVGQFAGEGAAATNVFPILCEPRHATLSIFARSAFLPAAPRHGLPIDARAGNALIRARSDTIIIPPRYGRCC